MSEMPFGFKGRTDLKSEVYVTTVPNKIRSVCQSRVLLGPYTLQLWRHGSGGVGTGVWGDLPSYSGATEIGNQTSDPANKQCEKAADKGDGAAFENDIAGSGTCLEMEDRD